MISEESGQGGHKLTGHPDVTRSSEGEQGWWGHYHQWPRLPPLTLRDYNYPGHRTGTLQCCRQAADDKSDRTQWVSLLCSVSGYVTHNWASQDPGHYGDITMPWHSYSGHPGTFYLSWITCSCVTCAPLYPVLTLAPWDAGAALNSCQGGLVWVDPAQSWTDKEKMMHGQDQDQGAVKTSRARCHIPSHS